jgi:hypothetical protein
VEGAPSTTTTSAATVVVTSAAIVRGSLVAAVGFAPLPTTVSSAFSARPDGTVATICYCAALATFQQQQGMIHKPAEKQEKA